MAHFVKLGGWFYKAAELAVILLIAEEIEEHVNTWIDARAARAALVEAEERFLPILLAAVLLLVVGRLVRYGPVAVLP